MLLTVVLINVVMTLITVPSLLESRSPFMAYVMGTGMIGIMMLPSIGMLAYHWLQYRNDRLPISLAMKLSLVLILIPFALLIFMQ